jgi:hypothetical protein
LSRILSYAVLYKLRDALREICAPNQNFAGFFGVLVFNFS